MDSRSHLVFIHLCGFTQQRWTRRYRRRAVGSAETGFYGRRGTVVRRILIGGFLALPSAARAVNRARVTWPPTPLDLSHVYAPLRVPL